MYICILVYDYRFYFVVRIKTISLIIMCPEVDFFFAHSACVLNGALRLPRVIFTRNLFLTGLFEVRNQRAQTPVFWGRPQMAAIAFLVPYSAVPPGECTLIGDPMWQIKRRSSWGYRREIQSPRVQRYRPCRLLPCYIYMK